MTRHRKLRSKKAGLPPGSLIHIGELKTPAPSMTLIAYGPDRFSERELPDIAALRRAEPAEGTRWLNVYGLQDAKLLAAIGECFGLHPLVIEDILNTDQRPKVDDYDDYLYLVVHLYDTDRPLHDGATDQVSLVIGRDFVLTFQERPSGTFAPFRQRLRAERSPLRRAGSDYLAYSLLDAVVDSYFSVIERLSERAETLEEEILGQPTHRALAGIHGLKREVAHLRRMLWPLRETLSALSRGQADFFRPETLLYLRDVYDHAVHVLESLEDLRDLLTGLLDIYLSTVSNRVNQEVRTLTLVATIFMPASLIAGIFGMNFHAMPWLANPHGFALALGLMGAIAAAMIAAFRYRKILR